MGRYGLIVSILMLFSVMIIFSAGKIMFSSEGRKWREVGEEETVIRDRVILPKGATFTLMTISFLRLLNLYTVYIWTSGQMEWKKIL